MMWLGEKPVSIVTAWNTLCEALWERMEFYQIELEYLYSFGKLPEVPCEQKRNVASSNIGGQIPEMRKTIQAMLDSSFDPAWFGEWVEIGDRLDDQKDNIDNPVYDIEGFDRYAFFREPQTIPSYKHTTSEFIKAAARLINEKIVYPRPVWRRSGDHDYSFWVDCDLYIHDFTNNSSKYGRWSVDGDLILPDGYYLNKSDLAVRHKYWSFDFAAKSYNHRWHYTPGRSPIEAQHQLPLLKGRGGKIRYQVSATNIFEEYQEVEMDFDSGLAVENIDFSKASSEIEKLLNRNDEIIGQAVIQGHWYGEKYILLNKENFPKPNYKYME